MGTIPEVFEFYVRRNSQNRAQNASVRNDEHTGEAVRHGGKFPVEEIPHTDENVIKRLASFPGHVAERILEATADIVIRMSKD